MNNDQFQRLREKYAVQCDLLHIDRLEQVTSGSSSRYYRYFHDLKELQIYFGYDDLIRDFEYLKIFVGLETLILESLEGLIPISIGCNLYKNTQLKKLFVYPPIQSIHEDFHLLAPQLEFLMTIQILSYPCDKPYQFTNLKSLLIGSTGSQTTMDFLSYTDAPDLETLRILNSAPPIKKINRFATSLVTLQLNLCDVSLITDDQWSSMIRLRNVVLQNVSMRAFPLWVKNLRELCLVDFSNTNELMQNDFTGQEIVIDESLSHLETILLDDANVESCVLQGNVDDDIDTTFDLKTLDIRNSNLDVNGPSNLFIRDYYWTTAGPMAFDLKVVHIAGGGFPFGLLRMGNVREYSGGFNIENYDSYYEGNGIDIVWENVEFGWNHGDPTIERDRVYGLLKDHNPDLSFRRVANEDDSSDVEEDEESFEPVEEAFQLAQEQALERHTARPTPYLCIYDENVPQNPFQENEHVTCQICLEEFDEAQHDPSLEMNNEFLTTEVSERMDVVFCNITEQDVVERIKATRDINVRNEDGTIREEFRSEVDEKMQIHYNHFIHLSCYQTWLKSRFDERGVLTCPASNEVFYDN